MPKQFHSVQTKYDAVINWTYTEICNIVDFRFGKNTWPDHEVCNVFTEKNKISSMLLVCLELNQEKRF